MHDGRDIRELLFLVVWEEMLTCPSLECWIHGKSFKN